VRNRLTTCLCLLVFLLSPLAVWSADTYTANPLAQTQADDLLIIIQDNHFALTGIPSTTGLILGGTSTLSGQGADPTAQFRIGSQSKMFTGTVILKMIDSGYFTLTDTLGALQQKYNVDLGMAALPAGAESITVEQLLNMNSRIPNYMAGTRTGSTSTLWDEWIAANYQALTPTVTHAELAALGLTAGYPQIPSPPFQGSYSNTNAVILSLIGEAAYAAETGSAKTFAEILHELVFTPAGLTGTYLATTSSSAGIMPGSEAGQTITNMDPTIPWTSGAVVSTLADQLKWIEILKTNILPGGGKLLSDELFAARTDLANSTLISMGGIPLFYGYNIFTLDFTSAGVPLTMIGHGGSIAGYSSFSAWYQQLGLGLVTNVPSLSTIDKQGVFTSTPSEALLMDLARGLERLYRSDGTLDGLSSVTSGEHGGYFTFNPITTNAPTSATFTVNPSGRSTSYLDLAFLALGGNPIITTIDPTLTYYTNSIGTSAVTLATGVSGTVASGARAEAFGEQTSVFLVNSGASLDLAGEVAAYGDAASAIVVESGGTLRTAVGSLAYLQGGDGSTLRVESGATDVGIDGTVLAFGSSSALRVDGSSVSLGSTGLLAAVTAAYSMNPDFETVSPETHAAYGAVLENGAVLDVYGTIRVQAAHPWDGSSYATGAYIGSTWAMPGVLTAGITLDDSTANVFGLVSASGYGAWMLSGTNVLNIDGGAVIGGLLSVKGEGGDDAVTLSGGGLLAGNIDLGGGVNSLSVTRGSLALDLDRDVGIRGAGNLSFTSDTRIDTGLRRVLGDENFVLASDVSSYSGSPSILNPYKPISFAVSENGDEILLTSTRDWSYYAERSPNGSLGAALDRMAAAAVQNTLSAGGSSLILTLDRSNTPGSDSAQLQPHVVSGLALSQVRQASSMHRAMLNQNGTVWTDREWFAFGGAHGHAGKQDSTGQSYDGYDTSGVGVTVGVGRNLSADTQLGVFLGYGVESQKYGSTGDVDETVLRVGPFVRWTSGNTEWSTALSMGLHDVDSTRKVPFVDEKNQADYSMLDVMLSSQISHAFLFDALTVTPSLEGVYLNLSSESYKEDGGITALAVDSAHASFLATTAGLEFSREFRFASATLTPKVGAAWWHQWLDRPDMDAALRSDTDFSFASEGERSDRDLLRLKAALALEMHDGLRMNLEYGRFDGSSMHDTNVLALSIGMVF
jgi:D-alanyl-D-alanine carboxypeptidase